MCDIKDSMITETVPFSKFFNTICRLLFNKMSSNPFFMNIFSRTALEDWRVEAVMKVSGAACQPLVSYDSEKRRELFLGSQLWKSSCVALSVHVKSFTAEKLAGTKNVVKTLTSKAAGWIIGRQRDFFLLLLSSSASSAFKRHPTFLFYFIPL